MHFQNIYNSFFSLREALCWSINETGWSRHVLRTVSQCSCSTISSSAFKRNPSDSEPWIVDKIFQRSHPESSDSILQSKFKWFFGRYYWIGFNQFLFLFIFHKIAPLNGCRGNIIPLCLDRSTKDNSRHSTNELSMLDYYDRFTHDSSCGSSALLQSLESLGIITMGSSASTSGMHGYTLMCWISRRNNGRSVMNHFSMIEYTTGSPTKNVHGSFGRWPDWFRYEWGKRFTVDRILYRVLINSHNRINES